MMRGKQKPINGVNIIEAYQMFGKWDLAVIYEANSNENALHFSGDIVRSMEGITKTQTISLNPLKKWQSNPIATFCLS
jgi:uncharacterized protein with GYD domain